MIRDGHDAETYVYGDFHGRERQTWPLAVIYWAVKTGQLLRRLPKPTLVTWTTRLLVDAGVLRSRPGPCPEAA